MLSFYLRISCSIFLSYSSIPTQVLSDPPPTPEPPNFMFFLFPKTDTQFNLCWITTPEHGSCPRVTPLKKTDVLSPGSYQLQVTSWLGVGFQAQLPASVLDFGLAWVSTGAMRAIPVSVSSSVHLFCRIWKPVIPEAISYPWLLQYLCPLLCIDPWVLRAHYVFLNLDLGCI